MRSPHYKIIFFDAAGTLLHLPRGVASHYAQVAARHGYHPEETRLKHAFYTAFKTLPPPSTTRCPRTDDDRGWWSALVDCVLDEIAAPESLDRAAYFEDLYLEFAKPGVWALYPEVLPLLHRLRGTYRLGIISNFDGRLRTILQHLEIAHLFEVIAISSEIGADKPDLYIYQRACELAGVAPAEALHAGDDEECDWQAAAQAGLHVFQLNRPTNSLTDLLPLCPH